MAKIVDIEVLRQVGLEAGLDAVGVASAAPFERTLEILEERRAAGLSGEMQFTYRNPARSTDASRTLQGAASLVVGALGYRRAGQEPAAPPGPHGRIARYARDDEYGRLRLGLNAIASSLRAGGWDAVVVADQNNLVDREAAYRAGIGWYGKSSNLLIPGRGSWFVLGSVITNAELAPSEPVPDGCGSCRRCIDGCPTGAIVAPGVVDARRCLAWLVQAPGVFPFEFRGALGDRIYGCDVCQEVCPPSRTESAVAFGAPPGADGWVSLLTLLAMEDHELLAAHGRWYIWKRDPRYVRRNALIALGNVGQGSEPDVVATLERYLEHSDALLRAHAVWAARRLGRDDLTYRIRSDDDRIVRAELDRPAEGVPATSGSS